MQERALTYAVLNRGRSTRDLSRVMQDRAAHLRSPQQPGGRSTRDLSRVMQERAFTYAVPNRGRSTRDLRV
jgi:hypothetical protein